MPLARIVTEFPDEAVELAMRLRSRGFQVETVSPKTTSKAVADLEVRLEECAVEDMLTHATEIAAGEEVCVFVAPGALEESARFDRTFSASFAFAGPVKREFAPVEEEEDDEAPQEETVLEEVEAPSVSLASAPVELTDSVDSVIPDEIGERNAAFSADAEIAEAAPQIEISEPPAPAIQTVVQDLHGAPASTVPEVAAQTAPQAEAAREAVPSLARPYSYWSKATASMEAVPSPKSAPPAPSVRGDTRERTTSIPVSTVPQFARTRTVGRQAGSHGEADRAFWRIAVASAALATLVVLVGVVWHRARPTPANLGPSAGQQLPFQQPAKKAAVLPAPPPNAPIPAQARAGAPSPLSVVAPAPTPGARGTGAASIVVPSSAVERVAAHVSPAPHKQAHSGDGGIIAEDTVIFYDRKSSASPVTHPQPAVKQRSDLQ